VDGGLGGHSGNGLSGQRVDRRGVARALAVAAVVAAALATVATALPRSWDYLSSQEHAYGSLTAGQRERLPGYAIGLPVSYFDFFRRELHRGDRYYLYVGDVSARGAPPGVQPVEALQAYARFYLLPATQASHPAAADVLLGFGVPPSALSLGGRRVTQAGAAPYFVARREASGS
jgi:hypothetical protein